MNALAHQLPQEKPGGPPCNIEAEQAMLGTCLYDNAAVERVTERLRPEHFFEPLHGRIWDVILKFTRAGKLAEPVLVGEQFQHDKAFADLGGITYLAQLVDFAPPAPNVGDYADLVLDLAMRRELIAACHEGAAAADDRDTPARAHIEAVEQRLFTLGEHQQREGFISFSDALAGAVDMAAAAYERDGGLAGLSTGLVDLDQKTGGMHPSDLVILAARPSMGKTSLACNIAFDVARNYAFAPQPDGTRKTVRGGVVAFFSLEMSAEQLAMRLLAEVSGVPSDKLRRGEINPDEFGRIRDAAAAIANAPLHIDATGGLSMGKLAARARRLKRTVGLDLIVVDYLQLVTAGNLVNRNDNRVQEVSAITQGLKALAKELDVPVLALSQLSRKVEDREDKKPQLADLRESGSIEQDADMVMFVYREVYYLSRLEPKEGTAEHDKWRDEMDAARGLAELIIGKQRHGPIGNIKLAFNESLTKFSNLAREGRYEYGRQALPYAPGVDD